MKQVFLFCMWFMAAFMMLNCAFNLINKHSTIDNLVGFTVLVLVVLGSYKTRCFTKYKI